MIHRPIGQRRKQGQPSFIIALVIVGLLGYSVMKDKGTVPNLDQVVEQFQAEEKTVAEKVKVKEPEFIITPASIAAYSDYQAGNYQVATIEQGTELKILDIVKDQQAGNALWVKVNSNGLNVWIKNVNLIFR